MVTCIGPRRVERNGERNSPASGLRVMVPDHDRLMRRRPRLVVVAEMHDLAASLAIAVRLQRVRCEEVNASFALVSNRRAKLGGGHGRMTAWSSLNHANLATPSSR